MQSPQAGDMDMMLLHLRAESGYCSILSGDLAGRWLSWEPQANSCQWRPDDAGNIVG